MDAKRADMNIPLLRVPREIRDTIYGLVLVSDEPVTVGLNDNGWPALLKTCKQINSEAVPVYLLRNTFHCALKCLISRPIPNLDRKPVIGAAAVISARTQRSAAFLSWFRNIEAVDRSVVSKMRVLTVDFWAFLLEEDSRAHNSIGTVMGRWRPNFN
jgi:hypothetical protein